LKIRLLYANLLCMEDKKTKTLLSWTAPEFIYHNKTRAWFIVLGIVSAALLIISLLLKNYFGALLVPIASFLIYVHARKQPRQLTIAITDEYINIGQFLSLAHKEITSFWIFEEPSIRSLSLETKKVLQPKISVLLAGQNPAAIREILIKFVPEKKHEEYFTDIIARKIKF